MKTFVVGGAPRDILLNLPVHDKDYVVVGASKDEMIAAGFNLIEATSFPVFLHPSSKEEYALARTEKKSGVGYHGFDIDFNPTITLEEDLRRRDLSINSLAVSIDDWERFVETKDESLVIDPYGGIQDLKRGILRHTSEAYVDDPLRILRTARFVARYHFHVASDTMALMNHLVLKGEMETLTTERVWLELEKAFMEKYPTRFVSTLWMCEAWERLFPEINSGGGMHALTAAVNLNLSFNERLAAFFAETVFAKVENCLARYKAPAELVRLIRNVWQVRQMVSPMGMSHFRVDPLGMLKNIDAYRRPDGLKSVCNVLRCLNYDSFVNMADELEIAYNATAHVSFATLNDTKLTGAAVGKAIDAERQRILNGLTFTS